MNTAKNYNPIFRFIFVALILFFSIGGIMIFSNSCNNSSESKNNSEADKVEKKDVAQNINPATTMAAIELKTAMRKLWEDHIIWTRNVICCLVDNLPGANEATTRLLKNQDDIGDAIKPYYGNDACTKLTELLHTHITGAAEVVKAAKNNQTKMLDEANKKWHENADSISDFLSKANPAWKFDDMKMMMYDHLKLTTDEAVARIKKDYDGDVKAYDKVHEEILKMADMLTDGIIKQYPEKFSGAAIAIK